ncbi:non-homologous end joining protein Ku [Brucella endophytica]|uniref:Non-homologous end joining protein Ku n=1 Tax=Brucella endophytica TaxID=1963359 RepID=A0A916SG76_9HYPH|nr:Ku protein [Brucella endophytica]GGA98957.1 non-homologous end joining protein Ku [Brucella endophytica]
MQPMPRANWKGYLKVGELVCPVALYTAASKSERISLHMLNRETHHRLRRQFVDSQTGKPVEREEQAKGYEVAKDEYLMLEPEEIASAVPESDKTLAISNFIPCKEIDDLYFDKPYYLAPSDNRAAEAFVLIREGMREQNVAALAEAVLFRRVRSLLIRAEGDGLIATTLNFDYEVRSAKDAFDEVPDMKIKGEMLDLAKHIIKTKMGKFNPAEYEDRYEAALSELVKAKMEGRPVEVEKARPAAKVVDLMQALRESAGVDEKKKAAPAAKKRTRRAKPEKQAAAAKRKAG